MNHRTVALVVIAAAAVSIACRPGDSETSESDTTMTRPTVTQSPFGVLPDGQSVTQFTLTNSHGVEMRAITYGATIVSLLTPDRDGRLDDVVLGHATLDGYLTSSPYFGSIVGRYGNRIAGGRFTLDGKVYQLATNDGPNHLHGGVRGFDKIVWTGVSSLTDSSAAVTFTHVSRNGEEGYPGTLSVRVTYLLTDENELRVEYHATTDAATPFNPTQHSYFNLAGGNQPDVLNHELRIAADRFTPVDPTLIPTGELATVEGTPFDFRTATAIGARIDHDNEQLRRGGGYDHNFVLSRQGDELFHAASVWEPTSGRRLDVYTTEPGIQLYTGNFLDGSITGKGGRVYGPRSGFCLETQHFPDSPNRPSFPSTILHPGQEFRSTTVFAFGVVP